MTILNRFSYKAAFKSAVNNVLDNYTTFLILTLIWWATFAILGLSTLGIFFATTVPIIVPCQVIMMLVAYIVVPYMQCQFVYLGLAIHRGENISVEKAFSLNLHVFFRYYLARLIMGIKAFLGFLLLILPGFYFYAKNYFAGFSILDDPSKRMAEDTSISHTLTYGVKWRLLLAYYFHAGTTLLAFILVPVSFLYPPAFLLYVLLSTTLALVDVEIFKQLQKQRGS